MRRIPLFILEEHHEAFFIWNYTVIKKLMPNSGNVLLHIDDHADLTPARFSRSVHSLKGDLIEAYRFTYEELGVATFIMPAIYQGLFNQCYWLRRSNIDSTFDRKGLIYSYNGEGEQMIFDRDIPEVRLLHPDAKAIAIYFRTRYDSFPEDLDVVLDIDLDYFSSNIPPDNFEARIETTREEWQAFRENRYHFLHFSEVRVTPFNENGRYYFLFNSFPRKIPSFTRASEKEIDECVGELGEFLQAKNIRPQIIEISRSRFSKYTPADQWELIEARLLDALKRVYDLNIVHLTEIFANSGLEGY